MQKSILIDCKMYNKIYNKIYILQLLYNTQKVLSQLILLFSLTVSVMARFFFLFCSVTLEKGASNLGFTILINKKNSKYLSAFYFISK